MNMNEIPMPVWVEVHNKWKDAYTYGWNDNIWEPCALCHYMNNCKGCPIEVHNWCGGNELNSRLHVEYYTETIVDYNIKETTEDLWFRVVERFLRMIENHMNTSQYTQWELFNKWIELRNI